jgi:5-methylcytosine-specific restriction protein A
MTGDIPEKADFEKALADWFLEAEKEENIFVDIRADDLHARIGDYPGPFHRMATCCEVMYENYNPAVDKILQFPPKGKGASMEIRYALPRVNAVPDTGTTLATPAKSFTIKCEYCHGTGRDVRNLNAQQKPCPAFGCGAVKSGLHSLPGKQEDYSSCKKCKGSGVKPGSTAKKQQVGNIYLPCPDCNGTGLTKTE